MAKYKKRADGRYAASVLTGYNDNGKPKRKYFYAKTIRELENKLTEFKSLQNKGLIIDDKGLTVKVWSAKWLKLYKANKAYNTYKMYDGALERHILPYIGNIRLSQLKKCMLQELINDLLEKGNHRTAEVVKNTLQQLIASAIDEQYIYVDIARGLSLPKKQRKEKRALTASENTALQTAVMPPKERLFADILYYTGLRRGEALALRYSDIDTRNKTISVNKAVIFKGIHPVVKNTPKTDASTRKVPIPDGLMKSIRENVLQCGRDYLFTVDNTSKLLTTSNYKTFWRDIARFAQFPDDVTAHILRHNYATKLYYAGVDIKTAQKLLGHSNIQTTLNIYTHLENDITDTTTKINNAFDCILTA